MLERYLREGSKENSAKRRDIDGSSQDAERMVAFLHGWQHHWDAMSREKNKKGMLICSSLIIKTNIVRIDPKL